MRKDQAAGPSSVKAARPNKTAHDSTGKKYVFQLTRKGFIGVLILLLTGFVWVFIFGIILGRGYKPEKDIPRLAAVIPPERDIEAIKNNTVLLKPEDLQFYTRLQEKTSRVGKNEDKPPTAETPQPKPTPSATAGEAIADAPKAENKTSEKVEQYDYTYQVAAFYDQPAAARLESRIKAKGLNASIEKSVTQNKTYYKVLVRIKGPAQKRIDAMNILHEMGFEKPIMRSKQVL